MGKKKKNPEIDSAEESRGEIGYWVMEVPVLSTAHLTLKVAEELSKVVGGSTYYGAEVSPTRHGAYVSCIARECHESMMPGCLVECINWAVDLGYNWIRFDADGDEIAELGLHQGEFAEESSFPGEA